MRITANRGELDEVIALGLAAGFTPAEIASHLVARDGAGQREVSISALETAYGQYLHRAVHLAREVGLERVRSADPDVGRRRLLHLGPPNEY